MRRPRGVSTAVVLLVLLLMSVIGMGVATLGTQNLNHAQAHRESARALYAAEAGIAAALLELKSDRHWVEGFPWTEIPGDTCAYSVTVTNNFFGESDAGLPDGTTIPSGTAYLLAEGRSAPGGVRRRVGLLVGNVTSAFQQAVFGAARVSLSGGASTDAFDSSLGSYAATREASGGDVVTNATAPGSVTVQGSSTEVGGAIVVGPGGDPASVVAAPESSYQMSFPMEEAVPPQPVEVPTGPSLGSIEAKDTIQLAPGIYDDVSATAGGQLVLTAGVYTFRSLQLRGNASVRVDAADGPVTVYIAGDNKDSTLDLDISGGGVINPDMKSTDLVIMMGPQATSARLTGGSQSCYAVYGPDAEITLTGGADLYGSVAGREVQMTGGSALHYDEALRKVTTGPSYLKKLGWQAL